MSDDMVERVAAAIVCKHGDYHPTANDYREMARAAIEAMRDPTHKMVHAGKDEIYVDGRDPWIGERENAAKAVWWAMIDAALVGRNS